ncbi:MAG TPA: exopolysaccharide biosynthesis polyprenyl glycosylphosphotransferase [Micropepsaceae bacterium]|nr:exopolysaccharide biosynthesis polyprenyl glycosylphosphotransferase [Micropepsaceae bacterium]
MSSTVSLESMRQAGSPELDPLRISKFRRTIWKYAYAYLDLVLFSLALLFGAGAMDEGFAFSGLLAVSSMLFLHLKGQYTQRQPSWDDLSIFWPVIGFAAALDAMVRLTISDGTGLYPALLAWTSLAIVRPFARILLRYVLRATGLWQIPTVIIGTGDCARDAAMAMAAEPMLGFDVQLFAATTPVHPSSVAYAGKPCRVAQLNDNLLGLLRSPDGPHVVIALEAHEAARARELIELLVLRDNAVDMVAPVYGPQLYGLAVNHLLARELLLVRIRNKLASRGSRIVKSALDYAGSAALLVLLAPVIGAIALLVLKSGRPLLYAHERIGRNGKVFRCYKFRTMVPDASEKLSELLERDPDLKAHWMSRRKLKADPRITPLGSFLRRTSLDELPQLFNVLKGQMSLVGPRPVMSDELAHYGLEADYYLQVKPGISGLWQVSGRNDLDYSHRVFLDVWYVKNWSLMYDCAILLRTPGAVLKKSGAY